jgi:hypothetical protein
MKWEMCERVWATIPKELRPWPFEDAERYVCSSSTEMLLKGWLRREKNGRAVGENWLARMEAA